jgi:hypothetical protein
LPPIKEDDLIFEKSVQEMIENNEVSVSEIIETISQAETTGERFFNSKTEQYIASCRLGNITQWVWYSFMNGRYIVNKAYSHRMEIE